MMFASETALRWMLRRSTLPFIQLFNPPGSCHTRTLSRAGTDFLSRYTSFYAHIAPNFHVSKMPGGPDLSVEVRTACVVLRSTGMQHAEIARRLELKPGTVRTTCTRVQKKAGSTKLLDLLQHCGTLPRTGRPPAPGAKPTKKRRAALKKQKSVVPVAAAAGPQAEEAAQVTTASVSESDDSAASFHSCMLSKAAARGNSDFATPSATFVDPTITLLTQHNNHGFQISNPMPFQGSFTPNN
jgi:hypothetical protein